MINQEDFERLEYVINKEFGPPFLKEGYVRANALGDGTFTLIIGRRDIHVDGNLRILGAGTEVRAGDLVAEEAKDE